MGLTHGESAPLRFTKKQLALLGALFVLGSASVLGYLTYYYNTTSLSASYTKQQRREENLKMADILTAQTEDFDGETVVTIVESAKRPFLSHETTYTAAVYAVTDGAEEDMDTFWGYSKSPASKEEAMKRQCGFTATVDDRTGEVLAFALTEQ